MAHGVRLGAGGQRQRALRALLHLAQRARGPRQPRLQRLLLLLRAYSYIPFLFSHCCDPPRDLHPLDTYSMLLAPGPVAVPVRSVPRRALSLPSVRFPRPRIPPANRPLSLYVLHLIQSVDPTVERLHVRFLEKSYSPSLHIPYEARKSDAVMCILYFNFINELILKVNR